jgi:hypothetical protein
MKQSRQNIATDPPKKHRYLYLLYSQLKKSQLDVFNEKYTAFDQTSWG